MLGSSRNLSLAPVLPPSPAKPSSPPTRAHTHKHALLSAVVIRAPVAFSGRPVPSGITDAALLSAGLRPLPAPHGPPAGHWGPDRVARWVRPGLVWPGGPDPDGWP